jgi:hypothetical protein
MHRSKRMCSVQPIQKNPMARDSRADVQLDGEPAGHGHVRHLYGDSNGLDGRRSQRVDAGVTGVHRAMHGPVPGPCRDSCCHAETLDDPTVLHV